MNRNKPKRELVFVYGTLKSGGCLHYHMEYLSARFKGNWATLPEYTMVDLGTYPGVMINGKDRIHGEVYSVTSLIRLDQVEGTPYLYQRGKIMTSYGSAWMYFYKDVTGRAPYLKRIESGWWNITRRMGYV